MPSDTQHIPESHYEGLHCSRLPVSWHGAFKLHSAAPFLIRIRLRNEMHLISLYFWTSSWPLIDILRPQKWSKVSLLLLSMVRIYQAHSLGRILTPCMDNLIQQHQQPSESAVVTSMKLVGTSTTHITVPTPPIKSTIILSLKVSSQSCYATTRW
jgi:hypothetical protein